MPEVNPAIAFVNEWADSMDDQEVYLLDGFEAALMGIATRFGGLAVAAYDLNKCIHILIDQGMTYEEAAEYFEFNVIGAWVGEGTPIFVEVP